MGKRAVNRNDSSYNHMRRVLAQEAARLICDHGIEDYRTAKSKAADRLDCRNYGALPSNREIEEALAERNRIYGRDRHRALLTSLRKTAVRVMRDLYTFQPCLVGAVLSGNVTEHSAIHLHLYCDASESVGVQLAARGYRYNTPLRRHRMRRDQVEQYPGYQFYADVCRVEATVFPERRKGHAPLCPVSGRPMQRAGLRDAEMLVVA